MAITNPCEGSGQHPTRRRITGRDLGTKFGGRKMGKCPVEGCDARVTANGRLAKHEVNSGEFDRIVRAHAAEPARKSLWGGY